MIALLNSNDRLLQSGLPSGDYLQLMLKGGCGPSPYTQTLIRYGPRLFPEYQRLLADSKTPGGVVVGILFILTQVNGDRSQFLDAAVSRLPSWAVDIRSEAIKLVGQIGSERDAAPVVALLADERRGVSFEAATALAAIGGFREVIAFDVWLQTGNHRNDKQLRQHVTKCRDELKQRLEKAKNAKR